MFSRMRNCLPGCELTERSLNTCTTGNQTSTYHLQQINNGFGHAIKTQLEIITVCVVLMQYWSQYWNSAVLPTLVFVEFGTKITRKHYRGMLLIQKLLPVIRRRTNEDVFVFWTEVTHQACDTVSQTRHTYWRWEWNQSLQTASYTWAGSDELQDLTAQNATSQQFWSPHPDHDATTTTSSTSLGCGRVVTAACWDMSRWMPAQRGR